MFIALEKRQHGGKGQECHILEGLNIELMVPVSMVLPKAPSRGGKRVPWASRAEPCLYAASNVPLALLFSWPNLHRLLHLSPSHLASLDLHLLAEEPIAAASLGARA